MFFFEKLLSRKSTDKFRIKWKTKKKITTIRFGWPTIYVTLYLFFVVVVDTVSERKINANKQLEIDYIFEW